MKNIVFINRKGGTGKSTCSAELVMSLKRSGYPVSFFDLDQQSGTLLETFEEDGAEFSVVDTPGALGEDTANVIANADVVCIPTKASVLDIPSLQLMLDAYEANRKKGAVCIIIVTMFTRYRNGRDFLEWLSSEVSRPDVLVTTLMQSEMFPQAAAEGKSVVAFAPRSAAGASTLTMVNVIRKALGIAEE